MGFFSSVFKGIKKAVKSVFKGVKKVFKSIGKAVSKVFGSKLGKVLAIAAAVVGAIYFGPMLVGGGSSALAPGAAATGTGGVSSVVATGAAEAAAATGSALSAGSGAASVLGSASSFAGMAGAGGTAAAGAGGSALGLTTGVMGSAGVGAAAGAALPTASSFAGMAGAAGAGAAGSLAGAEMLGTAEQFAGMAGADGGGIIGSAMDAPWGINQRPDALTADSFSGMQPVDGAAAQPTAPATADAGIYGPYKGSVMTSPGSAGAAPTYAAAPSQAGYVAGASQPAGGLGGIVRSAMDIGTGFVKENPMMTYLLANTLMKGMSKDPESEAAGQRVALDREIWEASQRNPNYRAVRPSGRPFDSPVPVDRRLYPSVPPGIPSWQPSWVRRG